MEEKEIKKADSPKKDSPKKEKESVISVAWIVTAIIAVAVIVVGILLATKGTLSVSGYSLSLGKYSTIGEKDATDKITKYINEDLLQNQVEAKISNFKEEKGVYKFTVTFSGKDIESYLSKDGTLFFPEAYDMAEATSNTNANANTNASQEVSKTDKPVAYLFTMSYCPYGNQAEAAMKPVVDLLKDKATIEPHYVIYNSDFGYEGSDYCLDEENKYCSMHGIQELNEDVRELCIYKYQPDKFWSFIDSVNSGCTSSNVDTCWEKVAKDAGIDTAEIKQCQSSEAKTLLAQEVELNTKYSITGSPALVINETVSNAGRTADGYKSAVCSSFNTAPSECSQTLGTATDTNANTNASCGS